MDTESKEINEWLRGLVGDHNLVRYEMNETSRATLRSLMNRNKILEESSKLIKEDLSHKTVEYKNEADRLHHILNKIGITPCSVSQLGHEYMKEIITVAVELGIAEPSNSSLLLALSDLTQRSYAVSAELSHQVSATRELAKTTRQKLDQQALLKRLLEDADLMMAKEKPELEKKENVTIKFLQAKGDDYRTTIEQLKQKLESASVDPSIYHGTLVQKHENCESLKQKLGEVKEKLKSFHSLPPDMSLACVELERIKKELVSVEGEISRRIDLLHM